MLVTYYYQGILGVFAEPDDETPTTAAPFVETTAPTCPNDTTPAPMDTTIQGLLPLISSLLAKGDVSIGTQSLSFV